MSYRELDPTLFSSHSTWLNLGLWTQDMEHITPIETGYQTACENLASNVARLGCMTTSDRIVDAGCGRGDSLVLWRDRFQPKHIVGVNFCMKEVDAARRLWKRSENENNAPAQNAEIMYGDAVSVIENLATRNEMDMVISVDAAYHFHTRKAFLRACGKGKSCTRIAASDIVMSASWEQMLNQPSSSYGIWNTITNYVRWAFLAMVCGVAGVPMDNLSYGPVGLAHILREEAGFRKHVNVQVITGQVFQPFSRYCRRRANELGMVNRFRLYVTGWVMGMLGASGAVDVVMYVGERDY